MSCTHTKKVNKMKREWEENEESEKLHPSLLKKNNFLRYNEREKIAANEQSVIIKCGFLSFSKNFFLMLVSALLRC